MNKITEAGFMELSVPESLDLYGGKGAGWWTAIEFLIDHGQDMWEGFSDGWNGKTRQ